MNSLPIVQRELRVVSRKSWMYWVRLIFALAGIIAVLTMFYEGPRRFAPGDPMLWILSVVTLGLVLFCGGILTADCISSEKRGDTLGLLFLSNLTGYDVVVGKIWIHAVTTACGLLAVFPVFFLPILAGGVTWAETLRVLLAIAVSFLFALTLGVWISTRSHNARNAVMTTLTALILIVTLPLLWMMILDEFFRIRPSMAGIPQLSPGMLLYYARDSWYFSPKGKAVYWISILLFVAASSVLATLASRCISRVWRHSEITPRPDSAVKSQRRPWRAILRGTAIRRRFQFTSPNPFLDLLLNRFKEFAWGTRFRRLVTLFFVVMLLFSFAGGDDEAFAIALMILFAMHGMAKFAFALDATRALNEDKRSSALELLLVTPLGERAIVDAQSTAFRTQYKGHVRRLVVLTLALQFTVMTNGQIHMRASDIFLVSSFLWGAMIWTWSDYRTIPWLGMYHALNQSTHLRAALRALGGTLLLPWSPYFVVLFFMAASNADETAAGVVTLVWAIGGAIYQRIRIAVKRARFLREFRMMVAGP